MTDIPVPEVLDPDQVFPYRTPAALSGPHGDEAHGWQQARQVAQQHHHLIREA